MSDETSAAIAAQAPLRTPLRAVTMGLMYRAVWRWHFLVGLLIVPFVLVICVTGSIYLFKDEINDRLYPDLRFVQIGQGQGLAPSDIVAKAVNVYPGVVQTFTPMPAANRSAEVKIRLAGGGTAVVYVDPYTGNVLGKLGDGGAAGSPAMFTVRKLHSLQYFGWFAERFIEGTAGWLVLMVASGVFLWWPRGRRGGVLSVRGTARQRIFWRDLHAVTGVIVSVVILFLAMTGMPWSGYWGSKFYSWTYSAGLGMPDGYWGGYPKSTLPTEAVVAKAPWIMAKEPVPLSTTAQGVPIALDDVVSTLGQLGLPAGYALSLPQSATGVFTASAYPDDVTGERIVHLDQYSGAVLYDAGFRDLGLFGQIAEMGVSIHMGQQFGLLNQLILLATMIAVLGLCVSGVIMWWKRRPAGTFGTPKLPEGSTVPKGLLIIALCGGVFFPMVGVSMLVIATIEIVVYATIKAGQR